MLQGFAIFTWLPPMCFCENQPLPGSATFYTIANFILVYGQVIVCSVIYATIYLLIHRSAMKVFRKY